MVDLKKLIFLPLFTYCNMSKNALSNYLSQKNNKRNVWLASTAKNPVIYHGYVKKKSTLVWLTKGRMHIKQVGKDPQLTDLPYRQNPGNQPLAVIVTETRIHFWYISESYYVMIMVYNHAGRKLKRVSLQDMYIKCANTGFVKHVFYVWHEKGYQLMGLYLPSKKERYGWASR
jgi:hypothetical protein